MKHDRWLPAYLGLGSNLGDSVQTIKDAIMDIGSMSECRMVVASGLYRSKPWGGVEQPDYINGVVGILTRLEAPMLLQSLLSIESSHGRVRPGQRFGPRTLDLDLLLFSHQIFDEDNLVVPHPRMHLRNFVIYPLADIAPTIHIGKLGTAAGLRGQLTSEDLTKISMPC